MQACKTEALVTLPPPQQHQPCLMLYQCLGPLICNDIAYCLLLLGRQRCSNAAWLARDGCAHPCKCAQCMRESQHALTPLPTLLPSSPPLAKGGRGRGRKVGACQRSCATHNALHKLHFAAPGAVCTHFLALSSSYCIRSRLCALLAQQLQTVHHSSRHAQVGTHRNRLGQPARRRFSPIQDNILI